MGCLQNHVVLGGIWSPANYIAVIWSLSETNCDSLFFDVFFCFQEQLYRFYSLPYVGKLGLILSLHDG